MKKVLLVIDMQKDFIDGALGSADAQEIVPAVKERISAYVGAGHPIIFTKDTHFDNYMETNEGKHLPVPHCIKNTDGWQIPDDIYVEGCQVIEKPNFGSVAWTDYKDVMEADSIELVGLCTDICVMSNALILKALRPEARVSVNLRCTAATSAEAFSASLTIFRSCQVECELA